MMDDNTTMVNDTTTESTVVPDPSTTPTTTTTTATPTTTPTTSPTTTRPPDNPPDIPDPIVPDTGIQSKLFGIVYVLSDTFIGQITDSYPPFFFASLLSEKQDMIYCQLKKKKLNSEKNMSISFKLNRF